MPDVNCNSEIIGFHKTKVTLSKTDQDNMRTRRKAGRTRLESGLNIKKHPQPKEVASQGSYAMRTMIQDDDCDYDIDDGAYFKTDDLLDKKEVALTPKAARKRICEALKWDGRLTYDAQVKRNCVRQNYPEGYHIDVPVYRIVATKDSEGKSVEYFELASDESWVKSDARAVTTWYNGIVGELNAGESDGSQMRRVTKLTKKLARSRNTWKSKTTSGICISKLVVDHFIPATDRDDKAVRETWSAIKDALDKSTETAHPVLTGTKLAEESDKEVEYFRDCLKSALKILDALDEKDCTRTKARDTWNSVFNATYFSTLPDKEEEATAKARTIIVTSSDTARRDDGGGRFG